MTLPLPLLGFLKALSQYETCCRAIAASIFLSFLFATLASPLTGAPWEDPDTPKKQSPGNHDLPISASDTHLPAGVWTADTVIDGDEVSNIDLAIAIDGQRLLIYVEGHLAMWTRYRLYDRSKDSAESVDAEHADVSQAKPSFATTQRILVRPKGNGDHRSFAGLVEYNDQGNLTLVLQKRQGMLTMPALAPGPNRLFAKLTPIAIPPYDQFLNTITPTAEMESLTAKQQDLHGLKDGWLSRTVNQTRKQSMLKLPALLQPN